MSVNDNGFTVDTFTYESDINWISEGAVIGFTVGWLVGVVAIYVSVMCFIRIYFKKKKR